MHLAIGQCFRCRNQVYSVYTKLLNEIHNPTLGVVGYSALESKFPPVACFATGHRSIAIYVFLIPCGILNAIIISELMLKFLLFSEVRFCNHMMGQC